MSRFLDNFSGSELACKTPNAFPLPLRKGRESRAIRPIDRAPALPKSLPALATRRICALVTNLSPFALAEQADPAAALITGLVLDREGTPIPDVQLTLAGNAPLIQTSDSDGAFAFANLTPGANYLVVAEHPTHTFTIPALAVNAVAGVNTIVFVAAPSYGALTLTARHDPAQRAIILSWPNQPGNVILEATPSLSTPAWTEVLEPATLIDDQLSVTVSATNASRFFRLRVR